MNDFESSLTISRLVLAVVELYYRPGILNGDIVMIETWALKYPN